MNGLREMELEEGWRWQGELATIVCVDIVGSGGKDLCLLKAKLGFWQN